MDVTDLLARLSGVRETGPSKWRARCPGHQSKSNSLAIRAEGDRILLHCFAGCDPDAVLGAVGLTVSDLFDKPLEHEPAKRVPMAFTAMDALQCLTAESALLVLCAHDIALGQPLSENDLARATIAAGRMASALEVVHGL